MKKLTLLLAMLLCVGVVMAQTTVSGIISDESGEPLIGANVVVKGSTTGTITDIDGSYTVTLPEGENTLVVSYIGYNDREIVVTGPGTMDFTLSADSELLTEVVVTGLGIKRDKKALGYSVADLSSEEISQKSEADPIRALSSKVPGVSVVGGGGSPGQSTRINIRGNSSLTGNTQPLFVVDGIPFDNQVNATGTGVQFSNRAYDIDPNNIESMTVLKGAAAAALYGSRATNGVVLITTKTGSKKGRKGLEVSYNSSISFESITKLPNYQDKYTQGSNQNYNGGFIGNWGAPFPEYVDELNAEFHGGTDRYSKVYAAGYPEGTVPHPLVGVPYGAARFQDVFPELLEEDPNDPTARRAIPVPLTSHDFLEDFFETGNLIENSFNFSAGDEKASLSATISRMDNTGIVPNAESSRTTLSFGGRAELENGLQVSGGVNYVNTGQASPPTTPSYYNDYAGGADGASIYSRLFYLPRNFNLTDYPYENPVNGDNVFYRALDNPRWLVENGRFNSNVNRVFGNLALSYNILPSLSLTAKGGINTYNDAQVSTLRTGSVSDPNGRVTNFDVENTELDFNYFATYDDQLSDDISLRVIGGLNQNQREYESIYIDGDGVIDNSVLTLDGVTTVSAVNSGTFKSKQRLYAVYGDVSFGFRNFLYLGVTARNDWTSTLVNPKDFEGSNNSYFYPGVSASVILSEAVSSMPSFISYAKLRGAWTQVGNEASPYQTSTTYRLNNPFITTGGSIPRAALGNTLGLADLVNELTTEIEFGADLRFFLNRVGLDFTWFKRNSTNQITSTQVPASSGFTNSIINAGEIQNKGIELGLNFDIIRGDGINWNTTVNFTRIRSLVIDAGDGTEIVGDGFTGLINNVHREGMPYGALFGTKNARIDNDDLTSPLLINKASGLPIPLPTDEIIGDPNPDFVLGLINTISFKGLELGVLFDWKEGGDIFSSTAASLLLRGQLAGSTDREGLRVVPGVYGDPASYEPLTDENGGTIQNTTGVTSFDYHFADGFGAYGASEVNVYDATVFRLREISLGYALPTNLLEKLPFGNIRVSVSARNLWFKAPNILEDLNLDPELLPFTADSNLQGIEFGATPNTKRIGVNLSLTF